MARKGMKKFVVVRDEYNRFGGGALDVTIEKAASLRELLEDDFAGLEYLSDDERKRYLKRSDKAVLKEWSMSNGDGMDYIIVLDLATEKVVFE
jgi:hypothetical protein